MTWLCRWLRKGLRKIRLMKPKRPLPTGDVRVIGLVAGTHVIEDIGRDVPHGGTITISAEEAYRSRDLWTGISQKCLMQLPLIAATPTYIPPGPPVSSYPQLPPPQPPQPPDLEKPRLEATIRGLESQVQALAAENTAIKDELRRGVQDQSQKLDTILAALQNGVPMAVQVASAERALKPEIADGSAPTFIPSEIIPKDVTVRLDIQGESSSASDVASAAERLRKMRKSGGGPT